MRAASAEDLESQPSDEPVVAVDVIESEITIDDFSKVPSHRGRGQF
jgi:hypothetical protein